MKALRYLKSNKGSSSVLVILIMLTLIVFGVLAMMSSFADFNLARRSGQWMKNYYILDGKGDLLIQQIDGILIAAENETDNYFKDKSYEKATADNVSDTIQKKIKDGWIQCQSSKEAEKEYLNMLYRKLYFLSAAKGLEETQSKYGFEAEYIVDILFDENIFNIDSILPQNGVIEINTLLTENGENSSQTLDIAVEIISPTNNYTDAQISNQALRYRITRWKQLQNQFEYNNQLELWDGEVNN